MKRVKYIAAALMCGIAMIATTKSVAAKPIKAEAFHWDFWNSYEDDCAVAYQQVSYYTYKVVVVSGDGRTVWRNDVSYVPYWYPTSYLAEMIGTTPGFSGSATCDIRSEVLNNPSYFAKFTA